MKIGFDVSQTAEDMAGCGYFSKQIISHLIDVDHSNQYYLYPVFYGYRHPEYRKAFKANRENVTNMFEGHSWRKINELWDEDRNKDFLLGAPDIVHSNNFSFPGRNKSKKVMTIYDMGYLDCPEYTTEANRLVCFNGAFEASIYADHIVTISEYSKSSFMKYFPYYPEERISVIYLGNRPSLYNVTDDSVIDTVTAKFDLAPSYWLGVGTIEPRKNYRLLLEAYAKLVKEYKETKPLYIAGGKGWLEGGIQSKVEELGISDKIKFLGYVTDEELSVLYTKCYAFIYPSLYEGFGLPVLEAMSCGAPVITSNTSSLPEVVGEAGITINPRNCKELIDSMNRLNQEPGLKSELKDKSLIQASKFSWKTAAAQLLNIYEKVLNTEPWHKT